MNKDKKKQGNRIRRAARVTVVGTSSRPRLSIFRSSRHVYVQLIDDTIGSTLVAAKDRDLNESSIKNQKKVQIAFEVGKIIANKAIEKGISKVVFDKGSFRYHGRVKALADGAREAGLVF